MSSPLKWFQKASDSLADFKEGSQRNETAVILHLYYPELWDEISRYLAVLGRKFDLFVSVPRESKITKEIIQKKFPSVYFYRFENRGRDIAPFLAILKVLFPCHYRYICKIHTKRTIHREYGDIWRQDLLGKILGSPNSVNAIKNALDSDPRLGIVAPRGHVLPGAFFWGGNKGAIEKLADLTGILMSPSFNFVAGSMYWFKPEVFKRLISLKITFKDFDREKGQVDGTLAHAFERFLGLLAHQENYKMMESDSKGVHFSTDAFRYRQYFYADFQTE